MPAISEILDSVSVPSLIKDSLIQHGTFEKTSRGLRYYSGGFTVVFPVAVKGEKWAFRCWHSELGNVRKRFQIVSNYINNLKSSYFCDFFYCDEGIVVDGKTYPTTRMKWVDGETINSYIESHINDPESLKSLASSFISMVEFLHEKKIAHGDLQHGNIIVQNGEIRLVDYDSIFVPGLEKHSDIITGKADFQHPKRKDAKIASEKLDYFSELVIYLSIYSISVKPELVNDFSIDDSLLFKASDWEDFINSKIYNALNSIDNDDIKLLLNILVDYLKENNINNLRPFTEVWRNLVKEPVIHSFECGGAAGIVYKGIETEITWDIENCSKVLLNGEEFASGVSVKKTKFSTDCEIELQIRNGLHTVSKSLMIHVVESPIITISSHKTKLRKTKNGIETTSLTWDVKNAHSVTLRCEDKVLTTQTHSLNYHIKPQKDTTYTIDAIGLDKQTRFSKSINITVREPSDILFKSDKEFTLPGVPITIIWSVKNAKKVMLNDSIVPLTGKSVFSPKADTEYILCVEDEFETKTERTIVRMLPLPIVKSILVDTPNINNALRIQYNAPHFEDIPQIPIIETQFESLDVPHIGDLKDNGLFVELPTPNTERLSEKISNFIKRVIG